jgi:hypothetical protein
VKTFIFILTIIAFSQSLTIAQSFTARVSHDTCGIQDIIQVDFTIENMEGEFIPPVWDDFTQASGPHVSSSFSMINGVVKSSKKYSYLIIPNRHGALIIPSATITEGTLEYSTTPIPIFVSEKGISRRSTTEKSKTYEHDSIKNPKKKRVLKKI